MTRWANSGLMHRSKFVPSGRYALPDFYRLDRTSSRLAHSFDHLVGLSDERRRYFQSECLCSFQVDRENEFRRLGDGNIRHLYAPEKLID